MRRGNIIGKPNNPTPLATSGIWNLSEQFSAVRSNNWPKAVAATYLDFSYFTHAQGAHPTTESAFNAFFTIGTPGVVLANTGVHAGMITWSDAEVIGAGGNTGIKPSYMRADNIAWQVEAVSMHQKQEFMHLA